ncbi:MAG TPA: cyclic pyranopterin monophosphate synthase MoaC [Kiritimatiellia bacterium]|nr:cyclic pyranopterin monophosphate synthase MoaC [Kiritimatiellia bacterium]
MNAFSHLTPDGRPSMVDISSKQPTLRTAVASAVLDCGPDILAALNEGDIVTPKGPVFQTAVVAGIQAAKRTDSLIPMCHSLPLDHCSIDIRPDPGARCIQLSCTVRTTWRTGVEMEALTGVTMAALTLYDMCKSISHQMVIREIRLVEKTGGKSS